MRDYKLTDQAVEDAAKLGLPVPTLQGMLRHSTRITHAQGNRRYMDFLFMVKGESVLSVMRMNSHGVVISAIAPKPREVTPPVEFKAVCPECEGARVIRVFDTCEQCAGAGCSACDKGLVPSEIACPKCSQTDIFGRVDKKEF